MKLLVITMSLPYPPASGGAIRTHGIVEGLQQAGHNVHLLCFHDATERPRDVNPNITIHTVGEPQRSRLDRLRNLLFSREPDIAHRFMDAVFAHRLRTLLNEHDFDLVQFQGIESVCYQPLVAEAQPNARRVFDTFNAEYELQRTIFRIDRVRPSRWAAALYSYLQIGRIRRYEAAMCHMAHAVVAVSAEDQALLKPLVGATPLHVVPSGIWVTRYDETHANPFPANDNATRRPQLVFTGKMDYRPNVDAMLWFGEAILPQIAQAQLTIVGQRPHPRLEVLRQQPNIALTGWVDSVLPYLQHADVYVAPLRMGSGTRLKLLEAMASGCAIVATPTAAAGLSDTARNAMVIAPDTASFAAAIDELLADPAQRDELGSAARAAVRAEYDWPVLIPQFLAIYQSIGLQP